MMFCWCRRCWWWCVCRVGRKEESKKEWKFFGADLLLGVYLFPLFPDIGCRKVRERNSGWGVWCGLFLFFIFFFFSVEGKTRENSLRNLFDHRPNPYKQIPKLCTT
ncbi:hypothetical protein F4775DRAFT_14312 [Biscogniauxia sp. FL1348]|nr:hypothetical protein F4775DRAFT_14312 [Biscogniauxia sp. FL1348]